MKKTVEDEERRMEDVGRQEGMFSEGWVMTWVGDLEWIKLTVLQVEVVAVFRVVIKGEPGVGELKKVNACGASR